MNIENYNTVRILVPSEGYKLTQKENVDISERMISDKIALGKYDSIDNYKEIPNDEADIILKEIDEYNKSIEENKEENID